MVKKLESLLARSNMKLEELAEHIGARVVTPGEPGGTEVTKIYAGDRVSDLLNEASDKTLLVSNLASVQMLRVAELMDVPGICFVNGVEPDDEVIALARDNGTLLLVSPAGVFETCGLIYQFLSGERASNDDRAHTAARDDDPARPLAARARGSLTPWSTSPTPSRAATTAARAPRHATSSGTSSASARRPTPCAAP